MPTTYTSLNHLNTHSLLTSHQPKKRNTCRRVSLFFSAIMLGAGCKQLIDSQVTDPSSQSMLSTLCPSALTLMWYTVLPSLLKACHNEQDDDSRESYSSSISSGSHTV